MRLRKRIKDWIPAFAGMTFLGQVHALEFSAVPYDVSQYGTIKSEYQLKSIQQSGVNTVVFSPVIHQDDPIEPDMDDRPSFERGMEKDIAIARRLGLRVILKPRLVFKELGAVNMRNEEAWRAWFDNYERAIMFFAGASQRLRVDAFVVGAGLDRATRARDREWRKMIRSVRAAYKGKIFYAAKGPEEAARITFWDELDFIGVDMTVSQWTSERTQLGLLSSRNRSKPVFITDRAAGSRLNEAEKETPWIAGVCVKP